MQVTWYQHYFSFWVNIICWFFLYWQVGWHHLPLTFIFLGEHVLSFCIGGCAYCANNIPSMSSLSTSTDPYVTDRQTNRRTNKQTNKHHPKICKDPNYRWGLIFNLKCRSPGRWKPSTTIFFWHNRKKANNNKQRDQPLINKGGTQGTNQQTKVGNLIIPDAMEAVVGVSFGWWRR